MKKVQRKIKSKIGPLYLVASERVLYGVFWDDQKLPKEESTLKILDKTELQLTEYFDGQRKTFNIPLEFEGTIFQKRVWNELQKIPYAQTRSYKRIAVAIKKSKAYRAVGTANGCNPFSIIVPCHRVINENGKLGGYAGGLKIKKTLLALESGEK